MRKVYLTITTVTMVPVVSTYKAVITADDNVTVDRMANLIVHGGNLNGMTIEDSGIESNKVQQPEVDAISDSDDFSEQVTDYITSEISKPKILSAEVDDSK